jgi:hypothetical protein
VTVANANDMRRTVPLPLFWLPSTSNTHVHYEHYEATNN